MINETIKQRAERLLLSITQRQIERPTEEQIDAIERLEILIEDLNEEIELDEKI